MTLNDLTVSFQHVNREELLSDWNWLLLPTQLPILVTAAGDAFLQDAEDGSVHFLDVGAGEYHRVAASPTEFQGLLSDKEFVVNYFAVQMVGDLRASGMVLEPGQVYSLTIPPILGGEYTPENIKPTDLDVHFSLAGQVHGQLALQPQE